MPISGTVGSYGSYIFSMLWNPFTEFNNGCLVHIATNGVCRFLFLVIITRTCFLDKSIVTEMKWNLKEILIRVSYGKGC